jgi:murein DD-endopeptidase MepM/ murein hydrolase activator NlpD
MSPLTNSLRMLLAPAVAISFGLSVPAVALALEGEAGTSTQTPTTSVAAPAPEAPPNTASTPAPPDESAPPAEPQVQEPQVSGQQSQGASANPPPSPKPRTPKSTAQGSAGGTAAEPGAPTTGKRAVAPSALTPALPLQFQTFFAGIPTFFIESFQVPPFLLPIFQAAGTAYGIPWQVLAAINEVETDYGRDLSVSSAGAEGWMQFLPAEWAQYGVDANGDGFKDPYNPADAIFAAARYLKAAGGDTNIRAAVFSYNHSPAYVDSVMLRAQLLGGTPSELLGAITGITQARFPVHAAAHFSDGFPTVASGTSSTPKTIPGTTIYSDPGAPVIAVQDGEIVQISSSPTLGRFISLRDAYGNTYTYAQLGDISSVYPLLTPRSDGAVSSRIQGTGSGEAPPSGPASAGAQPRSPLSEGGTVSGLALGASAGLEGAAAKSTAPVTPAPAKPNQAPPTENVRVFDEGSETVYLRPLVPGVQVIAGTVLGHVGSEGPGSSAPAAPHIFFQIRPAGAGAPLIDPKPILDGWVALENTSVFHARGRNPFIATSPTVGQVLLESKQQLQPQVLHDSSISLSSCARDDIGAGRVDKRVLAMLEYLSVSGMSVSVAGVPCAAAQSASTDETGTVGAVQITAIDGVPVAGHQGAGTVADTLVRKLLMMQGLARPREILSLMSYPGARGAKTSAGAADAIHVIYTAPAGSLARAAGVLNFALSPRDWSKLIARLGEIPDPVVGRGPSPAAIPVSPHEATEGGSGGHN